MAQAAPVRPVERVRNFYNRVGLPPVSEWMRQFTTRAQQAKDAGDPTLANMVKKQCETMLGFTTFRFPRYRPSDVHRAVCAQLERVEAREIDRLMLLMPPRHGKSELASKSYPAWSIGRKPWKQFISGSASMPLAQDWGREVRNIVNSEAYQLVYETRLSPDSQAAGKWNTQQGEIIPTASLLTDADLDSFFGAAQRSEIARINAEAIEKRRNDLKRRVPDPDDGA